MQLLITGPTQQALNSIFFEEDSVEEEEKKKHQEKITGDLLNLFVLKAPQKNKKYDEDNYGKFRRLKLMPQA